MITCFLIRHAEAISSENVSEPLWPLSAEGEVQAARLGAHFSGVPIAAIVSSPYVRAVNTVRPVAVRLKARIQTVDALRERHVSDGLIHPFSAFLEEMERGFTDVDHRLPGGESNRQVAARAFDALNQIADSLDDGSVFLASSHGNLITAVLQQLDPTVGFAFWRTLGNPAVCRIQRDAQGWSWDGQVSRPV